MKSFLLLLILFLTLSASAYSQGPKNCSYSTWDWNTQTKRTENHQHIVKPYSDLEDFEIDDKTGCTICEEDQRHIKIENSLEILICKYLAQEVRSILQKISDEGWPLVSLTGYRVGKSKGSINNEGLRTRYSNHSFGIAIDINSEFNGLYTDCTQFGDHCTLLRGGNWKPEQKKSITRDSLVYRLFIQYGWLWGGELKGKQKDFMHFSIYGD